MKAQTVSFPNQDITEIHVDKSLLKFAFSSDENEDALSVMGIKKGNAVLGKRLLRIKGITTVDVAASKEDKHAVRLEKGRLFDWKDIHKKVLKILNEVVAPNEKVEWLGNVYES